jgi:hypothetical protein
VAIAIVQEVSSEDPNGTTSGTTLALNATVAAGNTLVLFVTCESGGGAPTISAADTVNGAWPAALRQVNDTTNLSCTSVFVLPPGSNAGGAIAITATYSATHTFKGMWLVELSGAAGADGSNAQFQLAPTTAADAVSSLAVANASQPGMLVALGTNTDGSGNTPAAGTGFTSTKTAWTWGAAFASTRSESKSITTTAGTAATFTAATNVGHDAIAVIVDQAASGPPQPFAQPDPTQLRPARNPRAAAAEPYHTLPNVVIAPPPPPWWSVSDPYVQPRSLRREADNQPVNPLPAAKVGVSFVGSAVGTTSANLPAFLPGDIAVVHAFRSGNATAPTLPAGWTSINTGTTTTTGARIGYRILVAGDTTTGTWTNATRVTVSIYRGQSLAYGNGVNPASATSSAVSTTVTYPALTLTRTDGTSWVLGVAGHRSTDTAIETPPTGMVLRADSLGTSEAAAHDTGGGVASWGSTNVSVGGTSSGWVSFVVEIAAQPALLVWNDEPRQAESRPQRPPSLFEHAEALGAVVLGPTPPDFGETSPPAASRESDPRVQMSAGAEARPAPVNPVLTGFALDAWARRAPDRAQAAGAQQVFPAPSSVSAQILVHASGRYLTNNGSPWPWLVRNAWGLVGADATATGYKQFLDDTFAKGFTSVEMGAIWHDPSSSWVPAAGNGAQPFLKKLDGTSFTGTIWPSAVSNALPDYSTPNNTYWNYVRDIVDYANSLGLVVMLFPSYTGIGGADGWLNEMLANSTANLTTFGAYVATLLQGRGNIIWGLGGDKGTTSRPYSSTAERDAEAALISGLRSVAGQASIQYGAEWASDSIGTDQTDFGVADLTINTFYSFSGDVVTQGRRAYADATAGTRPASLQEGPFDQEGPDGNNVNANATQPVRRFMWWAILNSIGGHSLGQAYVWPMNSSGTLPATDDWHSHLGTQTTLDTQRLNNLWRSLVWWKLIPSGLGGMRTLTALGAGNQTLASACASDGSLLLVYSGPDGNGGQFTVDLRSMGNNSRARWWDPTAAVFSTGGGAAGTFTLANTAAAQSFTPPGANSAGQNDWVLVLDTAPPAVGIGLPEMQARPQDRDRPRERLWNASPVPSIAAPAPAPGGAESTPPQARGLLERSQTWPADVPPPQALPRTFDPGAAVFRPSPPRAAPWQADVPPPRTVLWGFDPTTGGLRPFLARVQVVPVEAPVPAGGAWWVDQGAPAARPPARAPAPQGDVPPPQTVAWGFDPSPVLPRPARADRRGVDAMTLPPPPFPPAGFDGLAAAARALARVFADAAPALAGIGAPWAPPQAAETARAARRAPAGADGIPSPVQVVLTAWGFEPEPPRTRSPFADRRLLNGEPLPARAQVVLPPWGFDLPAAPWRAQEAARRLLEHVAGLPAAAVRPGVAVDATAPAWRVQIRPVPAGAEAPAGVGSPWGWDAAAAPARSAARNAGAVAEAPAFLAAAWGWDGPPAAARAAARPRDWTAAVPPPVRAIQAPWGFDPAPAGARAPRLLIPGAAGWPLPGVVVLPPPGPWGFEPASIVARAPMRLVVGVEISAVPVVPFVPPPLLVSVGPVVVVRARRDPSRPVVVKAARDPARPVVVRRGRSALSSSQMDHAIGQGATAPSMLVQFLGADGRPEDLRGQTLTRRAKLADGTRKAVVAPAVAVDARNGLYRVDFTVEDTKVAGRLLVDFISNDGGRVRPDEGWLVVGVKEAPR